VASFVFAVLIKPFVNVLGDYLCVSVNLVARSDPRGCMNLAKFRDTAPLRKVVPNTKVFFCKLCPYRKLKQILKEGSRNPKRKMWVITHLFRDN